MPQLRQYPQVTSLVDTDAFSLDRVGTGTVFIETEDFLGANLTAALEALSPAAALAGTERIPVLQGGQAVYSTPDAIIALIDTGDVLDGIANLSPASLPLSGSEPLPITQGGNAVRTTPYTILNLAIVGLFSALGSTTILPTVSLIQTSGYAAVGRGSAQYVVTASTGATAYRKQSADGRWWTLNESSPTFYHFGAVGDGVADDSAAIAAHISWMHTMFAGGVVRSGRGSFKCVTAPTWYANIKLVGEGKGTIAEGFPSQITYTGATAFFVNPNTATIMSECLLQDILITAGSVTDTIVDFTSVGSSYVKGCWLSGNTGAVCSAIKQDCLAAAIKTITGITKANPAVVTSNAHGKVNGDIILITGVVGMTQVNNRYFVVAGATTNTFQLSGVNSSGYGVWSSGGSIRQLLTGDTTYNGFSDNYIGNVDYGIMYLKSSNASPARHNRIQPKAGGSGFYLFDDGFTGFPNQILLDANEIETSAINVIGINIVGSVDGVTMIGNRMELPGAGSNGISVAQFGATTSPMRIVRMSNYYSGLAAGLSVSDAGNLSLSVSDPPFPLIQCRLNGTTGAIVAGTNCNVDSASRVSAGRYNIQFVTLGLAGIQRYAPSVLYNGGTVLISDIATFDTGQFEVLFVDRAAGTPTDATDVYISLKPF